MNSITSISSGRLATSDPVAASTPHDFSLPVPDARQRALQLLFDHVLTDLDLVVRPRGLDGLDLVRQLQGPLLNRRHAHRGGPETGPTQA